MGWALADNVGFSNERDLVIGRAMAVRDGLIDAETWCFDWAGTYPVARLVADRYPSLHELPPMTIPTAPQEGQP